MSFTKPAVCISKKSRYTKEKEGRGCSVNGELRTLLSKTQLLDDILFEENN